ncbi:MAG: SDR family oxidoreductase [Acidobacteria bacterium]|nr:SDR family oxidoreductase [Acidobacteriota bacterium]
MQARAKRERDSAKPQAKGAAIKNMTRDGRWAIITGASSGLGKALALEFAAGGFNLLLTGRNETALKEVAEDCAARHDVETDIVAVDLAQPESIDQFVTTIQSKPRHYEVLVNNAGFGIHGDFASSAIDQNVQLLNVQLTAALKLTKALLPSMIARRSGKILNIASVYAFAPVPFQSVYSASKAFLLSFSSSLRNELAGTGVTVTVFCPGVIQTEFRTRAQIGEKNKTSGMTAEAAAGIAYRETLRGQHIVVPGFFNQAFVFVSRHLPVRSATSLIRFINRRRLD